MFISAFVFAFVIYLYMKLLCDIEDMKDVLLYEQLLLRKDIDKVVDDVISIKDDLDANK